MNISTSLSSRRLDSWQQFINESKAARQRNFESSHFSKVKSTTSNKYSGKNTTPIEKNIFLPSIGKKYQSKIQNQPIKGVGARIDAYA